MGEVESNNLKKLIASKGVLVEHEQDGCHKGSHKHETYNITKQVNKTVDLWPLFWVTLVLGVTAYQIIELLEYGR